MFAQSQIMTFQDLELSSNSIINFEIQCTNTMSEKPEERTKDSKKWSESSIEQTPEPPIDKQDPTEPVKVTGSKESKGSHF